MLAAKTALAVRVDALGEDVDSEMGIEQRAKLEARLRVLEEEPVSYGICWNLWIRATKGLKILKKNYDCWTFCVPCPWFQVF